MAKPKPMQQFQVYRSRGHQYLAVTANLALRITGRRLSRKAYRLTEDRALVKGAEVQLVIERPGTRREDDAFKANIKSARQHWVQMGMTRSLESRKLFFREVLAACNYFNRETLKQYDLRDVAQLIGIKSNRTFYHVLYLEARRQLQGKDKSIPTAKDLTLIQCVRNFQKLWPSIIGFSKRLDQIFKYELKLYTTAMRARSLTIEGGVDE